MTITIKELARVAAGNGLLSPPDWPKEGWDSDEASPPMELLLER